MDGFREGSELSQEIQNLEKERNNHKKFGKQLGMVFYPAGACLAIFMYYQSLGGFMYVLLAAAFGIPTLVKNSAKKKLTQSFKSNLIIPMLAKLKPEITYEPSSSIPQEDFLASNLFTNPDRYKGEDLFHGKHVKTSFSFSEIHAEKEHKSKNSKSYTTIFRGVFMVADFNKHIKNETYVFTSGGKWFSKFKRVKLENPVFEENFKVYSDNEVEARYILTPNLMEKIIKLEKEFSAQLFMSFIGSNVFIALRNNDNFFEPNMEQELTPQMVRDIVGEIDACVEIIDELDLNTRIWTKQ